MKKFSLKTKWRLAERLVVYNSDCKERSTWSQVRREGATTRAGPTQKSGITQTQRSSLGIEGSKPRIGGPALGSNTRKMSPLNWFKNQWDLQEGYRKPRLHSWRVCTHLLTSLCKVGEADWNCPGLWPVPTPQPSNACPSPSSSSTYPHQGEGCRTKESSRLGWGDRGSWDPVLICVGYGWPLLALRGSGSGSVCRSDWRSGAIPVCALADTGCPLWPTSISTVPHWVEGAVARRWESAHLEGTKPAHTRTSGLLI